MNSFVVAQDCRDLGLRAGALILRGLGVGPSPAGLRARIDEQADQVRQAFPSRADMRALPELARLYEILRAVGVKPRSQPPSTEKLLEYARKNGTLMAVNNLVDLYNLVSLRTRCSLGAHDLALVAPPITLRRFAGSERFRPLGAEHDEPVRQGEFGYVDAADRVVCRLDSRQAEISKVTTATTTALLIIEATTAHSRGQIEQAFAEVSQLVGQYCGGSAEIVAPWETLLD